MECYINNIMVINTPTVTPISVVAMHTLFFTVQLQNCSYPKIKTIYLCCNSTLFPYIQYNNRSCMNMHTINVTIIVKSMLGRGNHNNRAD